jgi:glutaredoxin
MATERHIATPARIKGRIVVFSIVGCPHCLQAKSTLQDLKLPYVDVSVDRFPPHVRAWLKERTGKTSVPQIFFNKEYIGGNVEFQALIRDDNKFKVVLDDVQHNESPDDRDPLLPNPAEAMDVSKALKGNMEFHCELDEYAAMVVELKKSGIVQDRRSGGMLSKKLKDSFTGKDFVAWAMKNKDVDRERALEMGQELITRKFGYGVHVQEEFKDHPDALYQLGSGVSGNALNADKVNNCAQRKAGEVGEDLRKLILQIFASFLSPDGRSVDYKGIRDSQMFETYKAMARELQRVELKDMKREDKLAFAINIYNALVIHGNIERGTPTSTYQRYKFFSTVAYDIGGQVFSLNDIENGILRGNKGSMATLYLTPFGKSDPRLQHALEAVEPRIHFALNCGAKSCPPIKTFSADGIDEQLTTATESYLENDDAIVIEPEKGVVHLSMLFKWYHSDFGNDKVEILQWIRDRMESKEKLSQLEALTNKYGDDFKVKYITYDWAHNSKD